MGSEMCIRDRLGDKDNIFKRFRINIELGRTHNPNKNPVAENAVKEFLKERLRLNPMGGPITEIDRIVITKLMNSRIRDRGLAAKEILLRRDLVTNEPIELSDKDLSSEQLAKRQASHEKHLTKMAGNNSPPVPTFNLGDRVYIKSSLSKIRGREEYKIVGLFQVDEVNWAKVRKADTQFRNKTYDVKCSELTKIPFAVSVQDAQNTDISHHKTDSTGTDVIDGKTTESSSNQGLSGPTAHSYSSPAQDKVFERAAPVEKEPSPTQARPKRQRNTPAHLQDFVVGHLLSETDTQKQLHGWSYADWEAELDDDEDNAEDDKKTTPHHLPPALSERLIVTSPENDDDDQEDLIDFANPGTSSDYFHDIKIGKQLDQIRNTHEREAVQTNNNHLSLYDISDSHPSETDDDDDPPDYDERRIRDSVISIGCSLQVLWDHLLRSEAPGERHSDSSEYENDTTPDKEDEDADDENDDSDESPTSVSNSDDGDDDSDSSDGLSHSSPPEAGYHTSSPPTMARRQTFSPWRGDSPRPGTAAARLAVEKLRIKRLELTRRRRQSSSWDAFADVATPVLHEDDAEDESVPEDDAEDESEPVFSKEDQDHCLFPVMPRKKRLTGRRHWHGRTLRQKRRVCYRTLNMTGALKYKHSGSQDDGDNADNADDHGEH